MKKKRKPVKKGWLLPDLQSIRLLDLKPFLLHFGNWSSSLVRGGTCSPFPSPPFQLVCFRGRSASSFPSSPARAQTIDWLREAGGSAGSGYPGFPVRDQSGRSLQDVGGGVRTPKARGTRLSVG
ncbi:hypothetical protein HJG60_010991 [Phyllostomus discolor]|uniref:Uncharacterized protein n=1 Tax=Phyllostomus discolor TaxID=89673 RepID=A0A834A810_9CHIR|nr:hypothetical protein HJG60_010991 [Phyllostomus discolor]